MGEKIGNLGQVRPPESEHSTADEIAKQLEKSKPLTTEEIKALENKDTKEGRQSTKLNKFGELIDENETEEK